MRTLFVGMVYIAIALAFIFLVPEQPTMIVMAIGIGATFVTALLGAIAIWLLHRSVIPPSWLLGYKVQSLIMAVVSTGIIGYIAVAEAFALPQLHEPIRWLGFAIIALAASATWTSVQIIRRLPIRAWLRKAREDVPPDFGEGE